MSERRLSLAIGYLIALMAGGLTTLSAAPFSLWWLGPLAIGLMYLGIQSLSPRPSGSQGLVLWPWPVWQRALLGICLDP